MTYVPSLRKKARNGSEVVSSLPRTLEVAHETASSDPFASKPRYGFTRDWLRTNLADRKTSEKGNWWSDESGSTDTEGSLLKGHGVSVNLSTSSFKSKHEDNIEEVSLSLAPTLQSIATHAEDPPSFHEAIVSGHQTNTSDVTLRQKDFDSAWSLNFNMDAVPFNMLPSTFTDLASPNFLQPGPTSIDEMAALPQPPLNRTVSEAPISTVLWNATDIIPHGSRPSISSTVSFQRPKKQVIWRGKKCIIALPLDISPNFGEDRSKQSTLDDFNSRLTSWENEGYDTRGFDLSQDLYQGRTVPHGQSRSIYPDPHDWHRDLEENAYRVRIPDKTAWDNYVSHLNEEKLRALGVSSAGNEVQPNQTPVNPTMNRQRSNRASNLRMPSSSLISLKGNSELDPVESNSSTYLATSASQPLQFRLNDPSTMQRTTRPESLHFPRHSVSYHSNQNVRPSQQLTNKQLSPGLWPQNQLFSSLPASRRVSPGFDRYQPDPRNLNLQTSLYPGQGIGEIYKGETGLRRMSHPEQTLRQGHVPSYQDDTQQVLQYRRDRNVDESIDTIPLPNRYISQPNIASPIPQGLCNNPSETLEKEIDDHEYHLEKSFLRQMEEEDAIQAGLIKESEDLLRMTRIKEQPPSNSTNKGSNDLNDMSDLDTNPSVTNSPALIEHPRTGGKLSGVAHSNKSSISKLNVNAQEFVYKPFRNSPPSMFAFLGDSPSTAISMDSIAQQAPSSPIADYPTVPVLHSTLNVAAPAFTPVAAPGHLTSRQFSFSSSGPNLKPSAPVFNPNGTYSSTKDANGTFSMNRSGQGIFENIKFPIVSKPSRTSKAIPIVNPREDFREDCRESEGEEDESGRITQADGRQKRLRRTDDNDDEVPQFAIPPQSPRHETIRTQKALDSEGSSDLSRQHEAVSPLEKATDQLKEILDDLPGSDISSSTADQALMDAYGKLGEPFEFDNAADAALFNTARPRSPSPAVSELSRQRHEGYVKMVNDIAAIPSNSGPAPLFMHLTDNSLSALAEPLEYHAASYAGSVSPLYNDVQAGEGQTLRNSHHQRSNSSDQSHLDISHESSQSETDSLPRRASSSSGQNIIEVTYDEPSFQEIDAVIQQLNGEDSDIGVERIQLPQKELMSSPEAASSADRHLHASSQSRSLPSSSPNRLREPYQFLPERSYESVSSADVEFVAQNARSSPSFRPPRYIDTALGSLESPVHQLNNVQDVPVSDWDDAVSSANEDKLQSRSGFFDKKVNDIVGRIVKQHLSPLEERLIAMNDSIARLSSKSETKRLRGSGLGGIEHSDADDEDDESSTIKTPALDRRYEKLKLSLLESLSTHQQAPPTQDLSTVLQSISELKESVQQQRHSSSDGIKTAVEEAVARQMRGKSAVITSSNQSATAEKYQLQIAGLESMLKVAEDRAEGELKARRNVEDSLAESERLLRLARAEAAEQRESAEETERSLRTFHDERQQALRRTTVLEVAQETLQSTISELSEKNAALEGTLEEYRLSSTQWREEIDETKTQNQTLDRTIHALKSELEDSIRGRHLLHNKFDRLQEDMTLAAQDIARDQSAWRHKEEEQRARQDLLNDRLETEARARERLELEVERLEAQEKEFTKSHFLAKHVQEENERLVTLITELRSNEESHRSEIARFERELLETKEIGRLDIERVRSAMQIDVESATQQTKHTCADFEAMISRLRSQLENASSDAAASKARYELMLEEASESRRDALREAADAREAALQEHYRFHERTLAEVKSQHELAIMKLSEETQIEKGRISEDRLVAESHLNDRLALADEKILYFQDRVSHLDEKLEIAKTAAQAAVQAVQTARRTSSPFINQAPMPIVRGSEIPEKVSPQALRETIMVLQDQLQESEGSREKLEEELAKVDKDAPIKIKDKDVEINWLRELLGVRIDELQTIIDTLSRPSFDESVVRDAAIRLKANLEMEQQEKERASSGGPMLSSLSTISNLAASPRALPLAAAAAWGSWRKGQSSFGSLSEIAYGSPKQTLSKASPAPSFLSGLLTPPSTSLRYTPQPLSMNAAGIGAASSGRRPLRGYSTPRQSISSGAGDNEHSTSTLPPPTTPSSLLRKTSYDQDAESPHYSLAHYVEDEQSSTDGKGSPEEMGMGIGVDDEPFGLTSRS